MKLQNVITFRLSLLKAVSIAAWAVCFYFAIIAELNDKTDKALTGYAESLITGYLAGEKLPAEGASRSYLYVISDVTAGYADAHSHIRFNDTEARFGQGYGYEPARSVAYIFQRDDGRWCELTAFTATIDKDELQAAILYWLIALYVVLLAGIVVVNLWTVSHSMRPLKAMLAWLDAYTLGRKNEPMRIKTDITEFRKLGDTLGKTIERGERQYDRQKMFIANASHEMQTPLAVCTNRIEMMLDDDSLTEAQMGELVKTMRTLKGLSATNRSLLLLCKIDNGQFAGRERIDLGGVADALLPDLEAIFARKRIAVARSLGEPLHADMDPALADILVSNLLKNAFTHNTDGGRLTVSSAGGALTVANTGAAGPLDVDKIFLPFYHSPGKASSTGLGLALAKAVCDLYGFALRYTYSGGMHTFRVEVPAAS